MGVQRLSRPIPYISLGLTIQRQFPVLVEYLLHKIGTVYGFSHSGLPNFFKPATKMPQTGLQKGETYD